MDVVTRPRLGCIHQENGRESQRSVVGVEQNVSEENKFDKTSGGINIEICNTRYTQLNQSVIRAYTQLRLNTENLTQDFIIG